jgi:hypothetical protein
MAAVRRMRGARQNTRDTKVSRQNKLLIYVDGNQSCENGPHLPLGSDAGSDRAATAFMLIETATLNSLDSQAYLSKVIDQIADHPIN